MKLEVRTFRPNDGLGALKVLEEAAECQVAYKDWKTSGGDTHALEFVDELADVVMAACNLAELEGIDLQSAIGFCEKRNEARGRYGE